MARCIYLNIFGCFFGFASFFGSSSMCDILQEQPENRRKQTGFEGRLWIFIFRKRGSCVFPRTISDDTRSGWNLGNDNDLARIQKAHWEKKGRLKKANKQRFDVFVCEISARHLRCFVVSTRPTLHSCGKNEKCWWRCTSMTLSDDVSYCPPFSAPISPGASVPLSRPSRAIVCFVRDGRSFGAVAKWRADGVD